MSESRGPEDWSLYQILLYAQAGVIEAESIPHGGFSVEKDLHCLSEVLEYTYQINPGMIKLLHW